MDSGSYRALGPFNYSHQGAKRRCRARKSRVMYFDSLTYDGLKPEMKKRLGQPKLATEATYANAVSALNEFLLERGITSQDVIGATLRDDFDHKLHEHCETLREIERPRHYVKARRWLITMWHRLIRDCDRQGAKEDGVPSPIATALKTFFDDYKMKPGSRGKPYSEVGKACGINPKVLARWANGFDAPRPQSATKLAKIEVHSNLRPGHFTDLLPYVAYGKGVFTSLGPEVKNRKDNAKRLADEYCLLARDVPEIPRRQYEEFVLYKINTTVNENSVNQKQTAQQRRREIQKRSPETRKRGGTRKTWRAVATMNKATRKIRSLDWPCRVNGRYCASAAICFSYVSSFWGWTLKAAELGGPKSNEYAELTEAELAEAKAAALGRVSLAQFADEELQDAFIDWRISNSSGEINNGHVNYLRTLAMMVHPDTGFLTKQASTIGAAAGFSERAWIARCIDMNAWAKDQVEICEEAGIVRSRDPVEPIKSILDLPIPMSAITDAIGRMDRGIPQDMFRRAPHIRNSTLVALAASIPLRARNFRELTYLPDNSGQLYETANHEWRIRLHKHDFKNHDGAASERDFDQMVDRSVWPRLRRYLKEIRPWFGRFDNSRPELVFVSRDRPGEEWEGINSSFFATTKKYVSGTRGFGPHSMRHIVATTYIIRGRGTPESIVLAASALNNYFETTKKFYMHILKGVGDRTRSEAMGEILAAMGPDLNERSH